MFIMFNFEKRGVDLKLQKKLKKELKDFTAGEDGSSSGGEFKYKAGMGPRLPPKPSVSASAAAKSTHPKSTSSQTQGGGSQGGSSSISSSTSTSVPLLKPCLYKKR